MRWPLALLTVLLSGVLLLPFAFPVAADGDGDGDGKHDDGDRPGDGSDGDGGPEGGRDNGDKGRAEKDGKGGKDGDGRERDNERDDEKEDKERDGGDERRGHKGGKQEGEKEKDGRGEGEEDDRGDGEAEAPAASAPLADAPRRAEVRVGQDYEVGPGSLTFTFRVTNHGQTEAKDVQLEGALPDVGPWALTDVTRCKLLDDGVDCELGDLAAGEVVEVQARSVLVGEVPAFTNVVQVYTPMPRPADAPSSP